MNKLHVVTCISNPCRYKVRYELYRKFEKHVLDHGADLTTVELAFGERPFEVTTSSNPRHLQLRGSHELWHKENMINLGIARLPQDWKYVAWVDADVTFIRPDWMEETVHQLQHYSMVQMFSEAHDMGPNYEPFARHQSFCASYLANAYKGRSYSLSYADPYTSKPKATEWIGGYDWHPGFAWAIRRETFDQLGGLIDFAPLGAADNHMAKALLGDVFWSHHPDISDNYRKHLHLWQSRALRYVRKNIGYVSGVIMHHWHGKKVDRKYWDRWQILTDTQFDPEIDLKRDAQGLLQLTDRSIELRDKLRAYFRQRNEDSIDFNPVEMLL